MYDEVGDWLRTHPPLTEEATIPVGTIIANWRLRAIIGRGGSAEIYRADDLETGEALAMKIAQRADDASRIRFRRERTVLKAGLGLRFPRYVAEGRYEGREYTVMELLHAIEVLPSSDESVADFAVSICDALNALHGYGFVHRDVKPLNVMYRFGADGSPVTVLTDFGLAKPCGDFSPKFQPDPASVSCGRPIGVGTPGYAAPEQFTGGDVSPSMDIHALGVMIAACFAGSPPRCWRGIVNRATSSLPTQRYATAEELKTAILRRGLLRRLSIGGVSLMCAVAAGVLSVWAWREVNGIKAKYIDESMRGYANTLPGLPPEIAWSHPDEDAELKIEGMLKRARNQYKFMVDRGINDIPILLPDFNNHRLQFALSPKTREKYGDAVTNLYLEIHRDWKRGRCGEPIFQNCCRLLY